MRGKPACEHHCRLRHRRRERTGECGRGKHSEDRNVGAAWSRSVNMGSRMGVMSLSRMGVRSREAVAGTHLLGKFGVHASKHLSTDCFWWDPTSVQGVKRWPAFREWHGIPAGSGASEPCVAKSEKPTSKQEGDFAHLFVARRSALFASTVISKVLYFQWTRPRRRAQWQSR